MTSVAASELIPLINRIQDILASVGNPPIDLPQIAVVGSQSSGKSSVLEAIVGKDFLPKGTGIVTRRPLVLQLQHLAAPASAAEALSRPRSAASSSSSGEEELPQSKEYAEFLHLPNRTFTDFEQVKREIETETQRVAGSNKGISADPIHLKIHSPSVVDLTLVDLPGLTKIPVGDQPMDIETQIRELLVSYIAKPNCIILAVSPANVDLANSDSLKLAREVDPHGQRTLGLLTKLDLMDPGTHAGDILAGTMYPLRLGFIGVVNRAQRDIDQRRSLEYARRREQQYFAAHPVYGAMTGRCGTPVLAKALNTVLLAHIRDRLPELKAKLAGLIAMKQLELAKLGDAPELVASMPGVGMPTSSSLAGTTAANGSGIVNPSPAQLLRLLTRYAGDFSSSVEGSHPDGLVQDHLSGGARLLHIFDSQFGAALDALDPVAQLSVREIRTAMRNASGARPALFIPEAAFDLLVKPQIARLEAPALRCVDAVYDELLRVTHECCGGDLRRYPKLRARVVDSVASLLKEHLAPARAFVSTLVAIQRAYINTSHPDFIGGAQAVAVLEKKFERERRKRESADRMRRITHQYGAAAAASGGTPVPAPSALANGPVHQSSLATRPSLPNLSTSIDPSPLLSAMSLRGRASVAGNYGAAEGSGSNFSSSMHGSSHSAPPRGISANRGNDRAGAAGSGSGGEIGSAHSSPALPPSSHPIPPPHSLNSAGSPAQQGSGSGSGSGSGGAGAGSGGREGFLTYLFGPSQTSRGLAGAAAVATTPGLHAVVSPAISAAAATNPPPATTSALVTAAGAPPHLSIDEDYDDGTAAAHAASSAAAAAREREDFAIQLIRSLISSYFAIVKKALADAVPKAVMHLLVNSTRDALQHRLVQALYRDDLVDELLREDPEIAAQRRECRQLLDAYQRALEVIAQAY